MPTQKKAFQVQEVTETLSKHFNGKLLFVAPASRRCRACQPATPDGAFSRAGDAGRLGRRERHPPNHPGQKPSAQPEVEHVWRDNLGEISRHLRGTKLEHVTEDEDVMTSDYPLLPVRRRFWERVLRTIDTTGTVSQLRSQLRVVHEAVLDTADAPLGMWSLATSSTTRLPPTWSLPPSCRRRCSRTSSVFAAGDEHAQLKGKLLKLIYLINKLPADAAMDIGLKATEEVLADLLGDRPVCRILRAAQEAAGAAGRAAEQGPPGDGSGGQHGTEYRLQTRESSSWYDEFAPRKPNSRQPQRVEQNAPTCSRPALAMC